MENKKSKYLLGEQAKKLLLGVLPILNIALFAFVLFLLPLGSYELVMQEALILAVFDAIGRGFAFLGIGIILLDYLEKKEKGKKK